MKEVMGGVMLRRSILALLAITFAAPALGQSFPSKPITMIVPFAAGGPTDITARIVGERMGKELGQQIIIDNVTGAAGTIAMGKLAHAAPDGYTIAIGHLGTNVVNGIIYKNLNYDLLGDLVAVARLPSNPLLVVTSNQVPAKDMKELVAYLKANADKVSGGTAGMGSGSHIGFLAFQTGTGINYQLVPYRGTGPAVQDLIANQIQIMIDQSSNSLPHVRAGKIRAYAVASKERSAAAPDIPTTAEAGFPGIEVTIWQGLWAPKGTPADIIAKLNAAAVATMKDPEVRRRLEDLGQDIPTSEQMQPAAFDAFQRAEFTKWKPIIEKANVKIE
jgi:tripartite-type tricarboxylate transporter receptor subunit TctC